MYSIWYKHSIDSDWIKHGDSNDYWDMINTLHVLRTILGQHAIVRYF